MVTVHVQVMVLLLPFPSSHFPQGGCDLWGDLDHWEQHAAGHALVPHKGDP